MTPTRATPCLGLIGGLGVGATIHYYQELVKAHAARGWTPHLLIVHADVNRVLTYVREGTITQLAEYLADLIRQLRGGGAQLARSTLLSANSESFNSTKAPKAGLPSGQSDTACNGPLS
jgi:aspartate/glutamate racemase